MVESDACCFIFTPDCARYLTFYSIVNNKICGVDKHTPFTGTFHHIKTYFNIPSSNDHMFVEFVGYLFLISIYDIYLLTKYYK